MANEAEKPKGKEEESEEVENEEELETPEPPTPQKAKKNAVDMTQEFFGEFAALKKKHPELFTDPAPPPPPPPGPKTRTHTCDLGPLCLDWGTTENVA